MIDSSHEGSLPDDRPLYFKVTETHFWMLDKYDNLMSCTWDSGCAVWEPFDLEKPIGHPALSKYMFWKLVKVRWKMVKKVIFTG